MASTISPITLEAAAQKGTSRDLRFALLLTAALTVFAVAVNGYHPYTEDGGLYLAGARHLLDPSLYPYDTAFVTAPTRFSVFAPFVAGLVRAMGLGRNALGLAIAAFGLHLFTVWATLLSAWLLACRCWTERPARAGAVLLLACWLGLPVAGTSLLLMDPYLTSRSFSTPLLLLALLGTIMVFAEPAGPAAKNRRTQRNGALLWIASLLAAGWMHPLMAAYSLGATMLLAWIMTTRARMRTAGLIGTGLAALGAGRLFQALEPAESAAYTGVALSRSYWFLGEWHWFEWLGIIGPVLILVFFCRRQDSDQTEGRTRPIPALAGAAIAGAALASSVALLLVHESSPNHILARLQPMRELQFVYLVMILLLGAQLGLYLLRGSLPRWIFAALCLGAPLYAAGRGTSPASGQVELPGFAPVNAWERAFIWIRQNTPKDALFALYPDYVKAPGEDAQCFRAIAERSTLPDYSKDGGEASVAPQLTNAWVRGQKAQQDLATEDDRMRRARLEPLGVSWLVLAGDAATGLDCPYRTHAVAVCRLR